MRNLILFAVAALLIAGTAGQFADRFGLEPGATVGTRSTAPGRSSAGANTLAVPGDRNGHFRVDAVVGGRSLEFVVDTGASIIALTRRDADRLGLNPAPRDFTTQIGSANGMVRAASVRLASVEVGPLVVHDVAAVVMPDGALAQNLLGMSFLYRLKRFEFRTGQLVLEQ
ncbi:MAG TPA: TIGR02281 family clan AA aspartic protease [Xanthobacteraceae bacterium]|nr:TIGR02281 family clan AA aspartic protease [Xanthobacteraceae bacterium]